MCTVLVIVEGLSPNTSYLLQLTAHTRVGPGPPASLSVKTGMLLILQYSKITSYLHCHTAEFKIKNKYLNVWPNTSVSIWPFRRKVWAIHKYECCHQITEDKAI